MAVLNQREKWIYLMEPHTASRAVSKALMYQLECGEYGHHHMSIPEIMNPRRTPALNNLHEWDIICTVRNPFDVLVTQWKVSGASEKPMSEDEIRSRWADDPKKKARMLRQANSYTPFIQWVNKSINTFHECVCTPLRGLWKDTTSVCYYEHLEEDLQITFNKYLKLPRNQAHTTAGKKHWTEYWTGEEEKKVLQLLIPIYSEFLNYYGYEVDWNENDVPVITINQDIRELRCRKIALR